ncbi:unnamed protein product, partial [Owenia fusiformis]
IERRNIAKKEIQRLQIKDKSNHSRLEGFDVSRNHESKTKHRPNGTYHYTSLPQEKDTYVTHDETKKKGKNKKVVKKKRKKKSESAKSPRQMKAPSPPPKYSTGAHSYENSFPLEMTIEGISDPVIFYPSKKIEKASQNTSNPSSPSRDIGKHVTKRIESYDNLSPVSPKKAIPINIPPSPKVAQNISVKPKPQQAMILDPAPLAMRASPVSSRVKSPEKSPMRPRKISSSDLDLQSTLNQMTSPSSSSPKRRIQRGPKLESPNINQGELYKNPPLASPEEQMTSPVGSPEIVRIANAPVHKPEKPVSPPEQSIATHPRLASPEDASPKRLIPPPSPETARRVNYFPQDSPSAARRMVGNPKQP